MLQNTIGTTNMEKISVADLLLEIEKAAVEKQSDLLNKVNVMEAKQERDKPIRMFMARLRGLLTSATYQPRAPARPVTTQSPT